MNTSSDILDKDIDCILCRALYHFNINHKYTIAITPTVIFIGRKNKDKFHW